MSPFGATRMTRGLLRPLAKRSTVKPGGAFGMSTPVRAARCDLYAVDFVAKGAGRSAGVIRRRTPGASVRQSPNASAPVRTVSSANAGAAPARHTRARNPSRIHPTLVTINPLRNPPRMLPVPASTCLRRPITESSLRTPDLKTVKIGAAFCLRSLSLSRAPVAKVAMARALHDGLRAGELDVRAKSLGHVIVGAADQQESEFGLARARCRTRRSGIG